MDRSGTPTGAQQVEAYIAAQAPDKQPMLRHLRALVTAAAPEAEEAIMYQMPGVSQNGGVVTYAAFKAHYSLFPMGSNVLTEMQAEIAPWRTSKGTLQFTPDHPMPDDLITRIVQTRVRENADKAMARKAAKTGRKKL